jgi:hypothetical protein
MGLSQSEKIKFLLTHEGANFPQGEVATEQGTSLNLLNYNDFSCHWTDKMQCSRKR